MNESNTESDSVGVKSTETKLDDEIRNECRQLCGEYLAGPWIDLKDDEIDVQRVEGGSSRRIFSCINLKLIDNGNSKFPRKVLLRKYGSDSVGDRGEMILVSDTAISVVAGILGYKGLGPKVYGIFEGGRIEEFIENRKFAPEEWKDDKILQTIMKKMVEINHLDMPIPKNPEAILSLAFKFHEKALCNEFLFSDKVNPFNKPLLDKLLELDIPSELAWIREMIPLIRSPVVFCHNDIHFGNIFERLDRETLEERVFIIDYENCSYGYRGRDIAVFLRMKSLDPTDMNTWKNTLYPEKEEKTRLLKAYLERYIEIHGDNIDPEIDNLDHLELEADFFTVVSECLWNAFLRSTLSEESQFALMVLKESQIPAQEFRLKVRERCELLRQNSH